MQVVLLERVENLGQMGDVVKVRPGYARNYLLPQGKALRATKDNIAYFETSKKQLEADNLKKKGEAEKVVKKLDGLTVSIIRQASEGGQLYGSVRAQDVAKAVCDAGVTIDRKQVVLDRTYKQLGLFPIKIVLHPEVTSEVTINIARTDEEAKLQLKSGQAIISAEAEESLEEKALHLVEEEETEETEEGEDAVISATGEETEDKPRAKKAKTKKAGKEEENASEDA